MMVNRPFRERRVWLLLLPGRVHGATTDALIESDDAALYEGNDGRRERLFVSSREAMSASIV